MGTMSRPDVYVTLYSSGKYNETWSNGDVDLMFENIAPDDDVLENKVNTAMREMRSIRELLRGEDEEVFIVMLLLFLMDVHGADML
jgi:hypothetical protein